MYARLLELDSAAPFGTGIMLKSDTAWAPVAVASGVRRVAAVAGVVDVASAARVRVAVGANVVAVAARVGVGEGACVGSDVGWTGSAVGLWVGWGKRMAVGWVPLVGLAKGVMDAVGLVEPHAASSKSDTAIMAL